MPNPPKTKKHMTRVIPKKKDGRNLRAVRGAAMVAGAVMARPPRIGLAKE